MVNNNLEEKIKNFKQKNEELNSNNTKNKYSSSEAVTIGIELVSGILVGLIIGTFFDKLFTSKPIFLIICILLGSIASFRNIWLKIKKS